MKNFLPHSLRTGLFVCSALFIGIAALFSLLIWSGVQNINTTLEIRASQQGVSVPDGFDIWHHLDANGIRFRSITPENNTLLITFDTTAQGEEAKKVLYRTLPCGYVIAQRDDNHDAMSMPWLSRLRPGHNQVG